MSWWEPAWLFSARRALGSGVSIARVAVSGAAEKQQHLKCDLFARDVSLATELSQLTRLSLIAEHNVKKGHPWLQGTVLNAEADMLLI